MLLLALACIPAQAPPVSVHESDTRVALSNGFVNVSFNKRHPAIDDIRADFLGGGNFGPNVASSGEADR